jgi:hypothetical protein
MGGLLVQDGHHILGHLKSGKKTNQRLEHRFGQNKVTDRRSFPILICKHQPECRVILIGVVIGCKRCGATQDAFQFVCYER